VIPLRDVIPSRTVPYITITIIVLNALVWFFELSLAPEDLEVFLKVYGVVPAAFAPASLITSMFLHGSWSHVIGNMWFLWIFGDNIEDRVGHGRYIVFYLLCGIIAALAQVAVNPNSHISTIGASGAIAGVMGAYFVLYPQSKVLTLLVWVFIQVVEMPAVIVLGFWFVTQLFSGVGAIASNTSATQGGGVAFMAHVAGFATGALGIFVFRKKQTEPWAGYY
jgi:membrane associated rhomboid family serine protease